MKHHQQNNISSDIRSYEIFLRGSSEVVFDAEYEYKIRFYVWKKFEKKLTKKNNYKIKKRYLRVILDNLVPQKKVHVRG